jgi:nickel-dependent lactate racemase
MRVDLPFGRGVAGADLPRGVQVEEWVAPLGSEPPAERELVDGAVEDPVDSPPLARVAAGARRVSVLVSGNDRVAGAPVYLPVILDHLAAAGVGDDRVEVVCATGTHARHSDKDIRQLLGVEVAERVRFRAQDCDRPEAFADLGRTSRGTPVRVDRGVLEADLRILTGRITHHYFAGFSGGRKSILPGVSARASIEANHRLVLDFARGCRVQEGVFGGNLVGNPVHEDMVEAARKVGPSFVVNTLLDRAHRVTDVFAGELEAAHEAGCLVADQRYRFPDAEPADLVVASPGGHPADLNVIQSLKCVFNHREAVRDGGTFILAAEAPGGVLRGMKEWMSWADRETLGAAMQTSYNLAAHNSLMLAEVEARTKLILVSRLPAEDALALGFVPAATLQDAVDHAWARGRPRTVRVIAHGNATQSGRARGTIARVRPRSTEPARLECRAY